MSSRSEALEINRVAPAPSIGVPATAQVQTQAKALLANLTLEAVIWTGLIVTAILTRFWDLGAKALHHDESLHAYYSWVWAIGEGRTYTHDPLMHGPLLFHLNALVYFLFGASDATSRYAPALFGVIVVWLPYLLRGRQFLGRWGALATGFLLLISPTVLYQSRYIRHDIYTVAGVFLMFIALVRYVDKPESKWLIIFLATTATMLANHEIIFANILLFASFMYLAIMFDRLRAWLPTARDLVVSIIGLHFFAALAAAALVLLMPHKYIDRFLNIPWDRGGEDAPQPTRQNQIDYYQDMLSNWLIIGLLLIGIAFVVGLVYLIRSHKRYSETEVGWLDEAAERSPGAALKAIVSDQRGLMIGGGLFLLFFVGLFTTIFTNWYGIWSSTLATDGTFLYWLGQHDVQRGTQPWFYFLVMLPQYEFFAITIGAGLAGLTVFRALKALKTGVVPDKQIFFRFFLAYWFLGIFAILSWAGEKMPWLTVHIALPGIILAGAAVGRLIERGIVLNSERKIKWSDYSMLGILVVSVIGWFLLAAKLTYGSFGGKCAYSANNCRQVTDNDQGNWWLLALPPLVWVGVFVFGLARRGWRNTAVIGLSSVVVVLALLQVKVAWRLSYDNPDVPTEMMVYTQTAPEVKRAVLEANQLTRELAATGDNQILWDNGSGGLAWPLWWYLRDNPNVSQFPGTLGPGTDAAVIFILATRGNSDENAAVLSNYTGVDYPFRWHFPEDMYRNFAIAPELNDPGRSAWGVASNPHGPFDVLKSIVESMATVFDSHGQQELFRLVVYRDMDNTLGNYEIQVYVRTDLLPMFNEIRY